jgi:regulator of protease activity HflC (stomatin/prohibitin superfamily)
MSEVVSGQEILTKDRVEVRLSLVAQYVVQDPILAVNSVENYSENLYQDLQLELRNSVVAREIDELLEARAELSAELLEKVAPVALEYGVVLKRVGVRDIILPRNVRNVFMQEVEADRAGRAELVRARHEVAAARARANAAKILTENPNIAHLQEIDAMVKIAGQHGNVIILPDIANLFNRNKDG